MRSKERSLADPVGVRASCSVLPLESLRFFWKVHEKNRDARLLTQGKPPVTKLAFGEPAHSDRGRLWCPATVCSRGASRDFPAVGPTDPTLKQGPCWPMLQERGLIICNLVSKAESPGLPWR